MKKWTDRAATRRLGAVLLASLGGVGFCGPSIAAPVPDWLPDTDYAVGAVVAFRGDIYESTTAHRDRSGKGVSPSSGGRWRRIGSNGGDNGNGDFSGFGRSVLVFDPSQSSAEIQQQLDTNSNVQSTEEFGWDRVMLLFKPGTYNNTIRLGYYMQAAGLGSSPDDVLINGGVLVDAADSGSPGAPSFWRSAENLSVSPAGGTMKWAATEGSALRRMHVLGGLALDADDTSSSGGFIADSSIDAAVGSGSQRQWLFRNSDWAGWTAGRWNAVFVGDPVAPATGSGSNSSTTVVEEAPLIREKPFLTIDGAGNYSVLVPALRTNSSGTSWSTGSTQGHSIPIGQFYVAIPGVDTAFTINAALSRGKHLLLTPGVYQLDRPLKVTLPDTVILGLGFATLQPVNGTEAMIVSDVDGVKIAGVVFDAGKRMSPSLLEVGTEGDRASHVLDPTSLHDLYFRVGGSMTGSAVAGLQINSKNVIGDNLWIWRADHAGPGWSTGWTVNRAAHGLVVNGSDVTVYGLTVEHFQHYQTWWKGDGGRVYSYQSQTPYDVPAQSDWMVGSENGYPFYKVDGGVSRHDAFGLTAYCQFNLAAGIQLDNAVETAHSGPGPGSVIVRNMTTMAGGGTGMIDHVIDGQGPAADAASPVVHWLQ